MSPLDGTKAMLTEIASYALWCLPMSQDDARDAGLEAEVETLVDMDLAGFENTEQGFMFNRPVKGQKLIDQERGEAARGASEYADRMSL